MDSGTGGAESVLKVLATLAGALDTSESAQPHCRFLSTLFQHLRQIFPVTGNCIKYG